MGKKTTGKKWREKEKNKNEDPSTLREARHIENELCLSSENGSKLHDEDKANNESRHEMSGNGVDFEASQSEESLEFDVDVEKKKMKKRKKNRHETSGDDAELSACENEPVIKDIVDGDIIKQKKNEKRCENGGNDIDLSIRQSEAVRESIVAEDKRKKKKKKLMEVSGSAVKHNADQNDVLEGEVHVNKKKKRKDRHEVSVVKGQTEPKQGDIPELMNGEEVDQKKKRKKRKRDKGVDFAEVEDATDAEAGKDREQSDEKVMENVDNSRKKKKRKKNHSNDVMAKNLTQKKSSKKVSFSDDVEVCPAPAGLVRGKRFSEEENEMLKKAVLSYVEASGLGEEGLDMVLNCRSHPETKNCWKEIAAALPWRPRKSIYWRAHIIFEGDESHKWSPEELELVKEFHEKHGSCWKKLASSLGKHRYHVRDAWQRIKFPNKKGQWSQGEYQNLFDLVNSDLQMRASEEKKSKHGMLRDNIGWEAISEKLATRAKSLCCLKWYNQLSSPLVKEGKWSDFDDYHLVNALFGFDACHIDDVDWDNLLEHRPGDICRKRWNQMVKHLGPYGSKPFTEQVEILSQRYCEDVLEAREAYNSRPAIDEVIGQRHD
ncbi:hypothetical protein Dsin_019987 [Dipteronia sinensis]|uniref:Uncharacterized protein n=1 Tax=Dipteronia sinensis TaxID=43782 RepID=A0AAE0A8G0_9ROSI|nr:hypothetical protein Dsin_019987 [Dipteronia sinensis]